MNARRGAIEALLSVIVDGHSLSSAVSSIKEDVAPRERALFQELCYGVVRWYLPLSHTVDLLLDKPLAKKHADLRIVLLLGLYQLGHTRIPAHAAVMESVSLADELGKGWGKGLVNAILRTYQRERAVLDVRANEMDEARLAHPAWMIGRIREAWPAAAEDMMRANNAPPPMALRINLRRVSREEYLRSLAETSIGAHAGALAPTAVYLDAPCDVNELPGFAEGLVSVQDEAAQLAAELLEPAAGLSILDACAAPGGKAAHLCESTDPSPEVTALDIDGDRLALVRSGFSRLGLAGTTVVGDAAHPEQWWQGTPFARILIDAPCSGTGVIRRNPDIKLLRIEADIAKLAGQQRALLGALWPLLERGGILVYATCSVLPDENWLVVRDFLQRTPDAAERPITGNWGEAVEVGRQLLPREGANDGFFYSRLEKV